MMLLLLGMKGGNFVGLTVVPGAFSLRAVSESMHTYAERQRQAAATKSDGICASSLAKVYVQREAFRPDGVRIAAYQYDDTRLSGGEKRHPYVAAFSI